MSIKTAIIDKALQFLLESKISPVGWLDGYKTTIGNVLTIISGALLAAQSAFCPGWQYCSHIDAGIALTALLLSLLVKLVGEWHKKDKALRAQA